MEFAEPAASAADQPIMRQRWEDLTFLHWPVDPAEVEQRLPEGLVADTFDGSGWVGLVPFRMVGIGPARGPGIPYFGTFWETNVRTYVVGPGGERGVWFDSLEADRAVPVIAARTAYGLPYQWADMDGAVTHSTARYATRRRRPHRVRPASLVQVEIGEPIAEPSPLEAFLTRRWRLFTARRGRLLRAEVGHGEWPLHRAEAGEVSDGLVAAAGYSVDGPPASVLFSPGVEVTAGRPRRIPFR